MPPDDALDRGGATGSFARLGRDPGPEKWRRWRDATSGVLPTNSPRRHLHLASCLEELMYLPPASKQTTGVSFSDSPNS